MLFRHTFRKLSTNNGSIQKKYLNLLEKHPLLTKSITSGVIAGLGDFWCQTCFESNGAFDWKRFGTFTFLGGVYVGPILHVWYGFLGRQITGIHTRAVMTRVLADQALFAPTFVGSFFSVLMILDGKMAEIPTKLSNDWWPTTQANWTIWIPAQILNFRYVPPHLQVLFSNFVGLLWNGYLSFVSYRK